MLVGVVEVMVRGVEFGLVPLVQFELFLNQTNLPPKLPTDPTQRKDTR